MIHDARMQQALAADFYEGLVRYHNTDGKGNGGHVDGVQTPPDLGSKQPLLTEQGLDGFMRDLSDYLSEQPTIKHLDIPTDPAGRAAARKKIAEERRVEVSSHVRENLDAGLALIRNTATGAAVKKALDQAPPDFFKAPSSSSGKYHPPDEINPGGLAFHSLRDVEMGDILCEYFNVKGPERDEILGALLLHDVQKGGQPWKGYAPDHGPIASRWLAGVWGQDTASSHMRELIANHMAQWNYDTAKHPCPTPPGDLDNQIVSYADYLGSLDDVMVERPKV